MLCVAVVLSACGKGNGLPDDLVRLLGSRGIALRMTGYEAPVRSRGGYVYFAQDRKTEEAIVSAFGMKEVEADTKVFSYAAKTVPVAVVRAFLVTGRPDSLKTPSGAQFEYLFLLLSTDGRAYLVSEYAYG